MSRTIYQLPNNYEKLLFPALFVTVCLNQTIENILLVAVGNNIQETIILDTLSEHTQKVKKKFILGTKHDKQQNETQ